MTQLAPSRNWARNVSDRPDDEVEALLPVLAEFQHEHPKVVDYLETGHELATAISDYTTRAHWEQTDLYNAFYRPLSLKDQLGISSPPPTRSPWLSCRTARAVRSRSVIAPC